MKVVVNMLNEISITAFVYGLFNKSKPTPNEKEQISRWLTGFIDGEGNFQVFFRQKLFKSNV